MAQLPNAKRIIKEDFDKKDQDLVDKLAYIINYNFENIVRVVAGNLTFADNFNAQSKDLEVTVDASGNPKTTLSYKSTLKTPTRGIICIRADNKTNPATYPTGQPFLSFTEQAGQVFVNHITGLQTDNKYSLRIIAFG